MIKKVLLFTPIFNFIYPEVLENHKEIIRNAIYNVDRLEIRGCSPEHGKSQAYKAFLEKEYTHIIVIDADIWNFDPVNQNLINVLMNHKKDIVGGVYVCKRGDMHPSFRPKDLQEQWEKEGKPPKDYIYKVPNGLFEVTYLSGGATLMSRKLIEELYNKYDKVPNLPMTHETTKEYLSEDFSLCFRARKHGYKIWADGSIKLGHMAMKPITLQDYYKYKKGG